MFGEDNEVCKEDKLILELAITIETKCEKDAMRTMS